MKKLLPSLLLSIFFIQCDRLSPEALRPEYFDYLGLWKSEVFVIEIFENGGAWFNSNRRNDPVGINGHINFEDNEMVIWDAEYFVRLRIDEEPREFFDSISQEAQIFMVLEDVEMIKSQD